MLNYKHKEELNNVEIKRNDYLSVKKFNIILKINALFCIAIFSFIFDYVSTIVYTNKKLQKEKNKILNNFVSYSQDFEDFILFYVFYNTYKGFYIDIGANDPNIYSVTRAFYEIGWHGINIEPLPIMYKHLQKFRKRDINLQLGVGKIEGKAFLKIEGILSRCSSIIPNKKQPNSKIININITTMKNICKRYISDKVEIQFCKIDVEGSEKDVLLGYDFMNYRPKVFCIENLHNKNKNVPPYIEWEYILKNNEYEFVYEYRRNRFYIDKRISGLKDKFHNINIYIKEYREKKNKL